MNSEQIQIVRETFALIAPRAELAAMLFYKRLFELDPSLRPMFRGNMEEQAKKLMQMLGAAVRLLDRPETLLPVLEDLGRRHVSYAVRDEHYEPVGAALLSMLKETLGTSFTPAALEAWTTLYGLVAETMKRAAKKSRPANFQGSGATPAHL